MTGRISLALAALMLTVAFAGCGGSDGGGTSPSPSPTGTGTTTPAPTDPPPPPGTAFRENKTFSPSANIAEATFTISTNWSQLTATLQLWKTQNCAFLQGEPPNPPSTTQVPAQVTITSPTAKKIGPIALGQQNTCDQTATKTKLGGMPTGTAASEMGTWKVLVNGRGSGVDVEIWVAGK